ncbi:hypothetical protein TWF718_007686 [Orbilia javanica]|uniref:Lectin n=1 Tax=Orbilia javanica TaxID=47235 RepID=A0AAN8MTV7_9PEZI
MTCQPNTRHPTSNHLSHIPRNTRLNLSTKMSYNITLKIINDSGDSLNIIEKTCSKGSAWYESNDDQRLYMVNSGGSGLLRFEAGNGEKFIVAAGIHSYKYWSSVLVDLNMEQTAMNIHPTYYGGSGSAKPDWDQLPQITKTTIGGRTVGLYFYKPEGQNLRAVITYA